MSERIEQKQSQMTTNYEEKTVHEEVEIKADDVIQMFEVHQTKILMTKTLSGHHQLESNVQDAEVFQPQLLEENTNYQQFHDEPLETAEIGFQNFQHQKISEDIYQQKFDQFEHFDDFEKNEQVKNVIQKKQEKAPQKLLNEQPQQSQVKEQIIKNEPLKNFAAYQNSQPEEVKQESKVQQKKQEQQKLQQPVKSQKKKKSKKKKQQQGEPLPIITADSAEGKKQLLEKKDINQAGKKVQQQAKKEGGNANNQNGDDKKQEQKEQKVMVSEKNENQVSEIKDEVSQIVDAKSVAAGLIIFEAQRERIGSTLEYFIKFTSKHEKHTTSQKQLILNVEDQIQKKKQSKTPLCNLLREYFEEYINLCKNMYEKSYKYTKNEKMVSANPMINMKEELKTGIDELIFLRKSTGNQFNRLGDFIANNPQKNVVKLFMDYWKAIDTAQTKHKEKKDEFFRKEKQFLKRIAKVIKVYTRGAQGVSQEQDLFIQMTKYINQQQDYRTTLIEYGQSLIPLKKAFIKAEQILHEQLQVIFNSYKNQFRGFFSLHPKEFMQIERLQNQIREKNTFQKLSDITDADYVRSVLLNHEKITVHQVNDKQFEKVLGLVHFEEVVGNPIELLKGTTSKSFDLKNKTQQVVDTISGNLLIFNKSLAQMKEKFIIKNINARIVQDGVVEIDEIVKGLIFNSNRTVRITFRDNDRAEELICFLNQIHENIKENEVK